MIEFFLAFVNNLKSGAGLLCITLAVICIFLSIHIMIEPEAFCDRPEGRRHYVMWLKRGWAALFVSGFFASLPNMDQIWHARIALIKFELASPKNIEGASETIERIGKRLECKYLGCDEAKK